MMHNEENGREPSSKNAHPSTESGSFRRIGWLPTSTAIGFVVAAVVVALIAYFSFISLENRAIAVERLTHTTDVVRQLQLLLSTLKDAETGQRGFLLTGAPQYLEPYSSARAELTGVVGALRRLTVDNPRQQERLDVLERHAADKMAELEQTIALRQSGRAEEAMAVVRSDRGRASMDAVRATVATMETEEQQLFGQRRREWEDATAFSVAFTWGSSALLLFLIATAAVLSSRDHRARESVAWVRAGLAGLAQRIQGERRLEALGERVLEFLAHYMDAQVGTVLVAESHGSLRRFAAYALPRNMNGDALDVRAGDSLAGQAAKENRPLHVRDVPAGYLDAGSTLGRAKPRELVVVPASTDGVVRAVIELGFFRRLRPADHELLARVSESLGVAVRASIDRTHLEELLEETQRQAEELQAQQEELRVSNEELEEQGRALKASQAQLEAQQAELEQTNSHLEEQTQLLETQKEDLSRAQLTLTDKAGELERANRYKSEFLANMSHELRTPLNSTLILAKLLADNKEGNLTGEQIKFAQTISSAGNDLLALINDVLDLAKIEAGKIDVDPEAVDLRRAIDSLATGFQHVARDKGIALDVEIDPGMPAAIETDPQRLAQILKNLVSNALKFTERGRVAIRVSAAADMVSFAVSDTGIGIAENQKGIIFEAFRQADGSTHRRYGGTGLGLSISRDLARLLGGDIEVRSTPGEGSVFTLRLPLVYAGPASASARTVEAGSVAAIEPAPVRRVVASPAVDDDREHLAANTRRILVIEDDGRFATILRDLLHEMGYQCIVALSANEGLAAASEYLPSAILLDINLPDHSGLGVLDQLKRNPLTRHIPVHVVSVEDYSKEALELGAVGYALKPVKREELIQAFQVLEAKFSQGMRRVLVVEDDERQRQSIRLLLGTGEVEITDVDSAGAAFEKLQSTTFDCMVMDLNLPDLSGYELLEKMAGDNSVAFPPVIVYTGRSLTRDEEQKLRRFSRSIIVKDARSPERLLDEVTLFLHQVESKLPPESQRMLKLARDREAVFEGRRILVVEDDVRNIFALTRVLEPKGARIEIARNGREALEALERNNAGMDGAEAIDLVLMDIMMPEMDGITAMREIRKRAEWRKLPIIALTAKAMKDDQEKCLAAGANDYIAKPLNVEKLLSLVRVWMPK